MAVIQINTHRYDRTDTKRFGGFVTYWKLYLPLVRMVKATMSSCSVIEQLYSVIMLLVKTPWWLLIKPFGCLFVVKKRSIGETKHRNNHLIYSCDDTTVVWYFTFIPVFSYRIQHSNGIRVQ